MILDKLNYFMGVFSYTIKVLKRRVKKRELVWTKVSPNFCNNTIGRQCFSAAGKYHH